MTKRRLFGSARRKVFGLMCLAFLYHLASAQYDSSEVEAKPDTFYASESQCNGEWRFPPNCSAFTCDYKASWEYKDENDLIIFTISTKNRNKWTGIGFSDDQSMPNSDAIIGLVEESGRYFLMDSYLEAYEAPTLDQQQNLYQMNAWRENGITTLKFSRPRQTNDSRDYQFSDQNCPYFIFPVAGGVFNAVNKRLRKHESTPVVSEQRICIRSCRAQSTTTTSTTTTTTTTMTSSSTEPRVKSVLDHKSTKSIEDEEEDEREQTKLYRIELKFFNLLNAQNKQVNSNAYHETLATVEESIYRELKPLFDRVRRVEINEIIKEDKSADGRNVLAIIDISVGQTLANNVEQDDTQALTVALNSVIKDSLVGETSVDPHYLVITRKDGKPKGWLSDITIGGFDKLSEEEQKWIIIGAGISSLVLLALIQLLCMLCRCCKSQSKQEEYLNEKENVDKQWKEYSAGGGNNFPNMYNGYVDEFGYAAGKTNSLHKNYRDHGGERHSSEYHPQYHHHHHHPSQHQSLDRRQYEHGRRNHHYDDQRLQDKHYKAHQMQPDFYFMPHQRKYTSDVVRVFVDYDAN